MEVGSASRVLGGAIVVLDSVEGVEAQIKGVRQQLNRYAGKLELPCLHSRLIAYCYASDTAFLHG